MADGQTNPSSAPRMPKKTIALIVGVGLALIAITVVATVFSLKHFNKGEPKADAKSEFTPISPAIYFPLSPNFVVNFNVDGRQRFLQAEMNLMFRDPTLQEQLILHMPAIRNGIVMILSKQDFAVLHTAEGKEQLRQEVLNAVRDILKTEHEHLNQRSSSANAMLTNVEQVLFTNFVMQ